ncbi:hypothetical protein AWB69_01664 [Caballeronia udeis]|uniref:Uncharacterized protein n=1 Tax=Caballeronia udeis TaxID=1232866 RepID=A0A158FV57_9BURK|nr:hypothetical protein AWB69_01664 [Caballeronia udeis]
MRRAAIYENNGAAHATNPPRCDAVNAREAVLVSGLSCLPESTGGEACSCQDSREGGVQTSVALASTVLLGHP